ncbi:hypothetical protein [Nitrosovibrio sp. Nv4]|uniref:hypothetical protein n=1 Tax=Nitrosovibrio sp. Nv4 TaxID=1945880 RepID=UPI000BCA1E82|nr:hypothetical protein [Nitrosovibrio sp. Nv4]SOD41601.1 hypothetical protein SAMN06298226_1903 [Nitrosovibrio sp. Nv4]
MVAVLNPYRAYLPLLGVGAGVVLAIYLARKANIIPSFNEIAYNTGSAAVEAVDSVLTGTVEATGAIFGIPKTDKTQCQRDIEAGHMWDASFSCPARDFLGAAWDRL